MPGWRSNARRGLPPGPIRSVDGGGRSAILQASAVTASAAMAAREGEAFPLGLSPKPLAHRYEALDSLRGICALLVCLFHFRANSPLISMAFVRGSWLFVDFFFVLSGFVIAANYRQRLINGGFLRGFVILRFGRVYPLHLVMLLAYIAMELVGLVMASRGAWRGRCSMPIIRWPRSLPISPSPSRSGCTMC